MALSKGAERREEGKDKGRGIWKGEGGGGRSKRERTGKGKRKKRREGRGGSKGEAVGGLRRHFSGFHLYRVEELPPSLLAGLSFPSELSLLPEMGTLLISETLAS